MIKPWQLLKKLIKKPVYTAKRALNTHADNPKITNNSNEPLSEDIKRLVLPSVNGYWLKYRYGNVPVFGIEHLREQSPFLNIEIGALANLVLETDNQFDNKSIAVTTSDGKKIGYLLKDEKLTNLAYEHLQAGCRVLCLISSLSYDDYELALLVGFYVKKL